MVVVFVAVVVVLSGKVCDCCCPPPPLVCGLEHEQTQTRRKGAQHVKWGEHAYVFVAGDENGTHKCRAFYFGWTLKLAVLGRVGLSIYPRCVYVCSFFGEGGYSLPDVCGTAVSCCADAFARWDA